MAWGSPAEQETQNRMFLVLAAYGYEFRGESLVSDADFDRMCLAVNLDLDTGPWDDWWRREFQPDTGMWIHAHPDLGGVARLYDRFCRGFQ